MAVIDDGSLNVLLTTISGPKQQNQGESWKHFFMLFQLLENG